MVRKIASSFLLLALFATLAGAEESKSTISGFGFWVDNNVFGSEFGDLRFEQVWLTIEQTIIDTMAKDTTI
ncbi:hypothetical protein KKF64_03210, partial [Patescibacteria group bacterium]|nr:hypothetical protein [Patescibacteria group bacterium]